MDNDKRVGHLCELIKVVKKIYSQICILNFKNFQRST